MKTGLMLVACVLLSSISSFAADSTFCSTVPVKADGSPLPTNVRLYRFTFQRPDLAFPYSHFGAQVTPLSGGNGPYLCNRIVGAEGELRSIFCTRFGGELGSSQTDIELKKNSAGLFQLTVNEFISGRSRSGTPTKTLVSQSAANQLYCSEMKY